jgi:hypothetical protein
LAKIDPREVFEVCECCLFEAEPQICSQCGMFRFERGRNYFVPKNRTIMTAMEIVERVNRERREPD